MSAVRGITRIAPEPWSNHQARRRYHFGLTPVQAIEHDPKKWAEYIPQSTLECIGKWLESIPNDQKWFQQPIRAAPRREVVFPVQSSVRDALHAHVKTLPRKVHAWFDLDGLAEMTPKYQKAWFYSFEHIYTPAFKKWVMRAVDILNESHARVYYASPMRGVQKHGKRANTIQGVTMPDGKAGTVLLPKRPKCVKCNRKGHDLYFQACACGTHYADRCLRCKVIQWALEGAYGKQLGPKKSMHKWLQDDGVEFDGRGQCSNTCQQSFDLAHVIRVVQ